MNLTGTGTDLGNYFILTKLGYVEEESCCKIAGDTKINVILHFLGIFRMRDGELDGEGEKKGLLNFLVLTN